MKILYLYAELMPYQIVVFQELVKNYSAEVIAVHWDNKQTPYVPPTLDFVSYYSRSEFRNRQDLLSFVKNVSPDLIYTSGWMDPHYCYVAKIMKAKGIPTIAGSDTQWTGNKQWFNVLLSKFRQQKWFSHLWVAGPYQYEYARRLGFKKEQIIFNSLTANNNLFREADMTNQNAIPHTFVFIGRFHEVKGISVLIDAFKRFKEKTNNNWKLICIGNGSLKNMLEDVANVEVLEFMDQKELVKISHKFGLFILPSVSEPWGVAIHEAACLGLPLLLSSKCGAIPTFLINGYNGFSFAPNSVDELERRMTQIAEMRAEDLLKMKKNSLKLSERISPEIAAASLISVLKN